MEAQKIQAVRCSCSYFSPTDNPTLKWVTVQENGRPVEKVICKGNGRRSCGKLLTPEMIEVKGLRALSRKSRHSS